MGTKERPQRPLLVVKLDQRFDRGHLLRLIKAIADAILKGLSTSPCSDRSPASRRFESVAFFAAVLICFALFTPGVGAARSRGKTATPTPTPGAINPTSCITITNPANNATVSGSSVAINTNDSCTGVWWEALQVDGIPAGGFVPGEVVFNSTTVANGDHLITVTSQSENPGSVVLGSASVTLNVQNAATASPSSSPTPTAIPTAPPPDSTSTTSAPTATPSPPTPAPTTTPSATATAALVHYSMLGPGAALPSESTCVAQVNASPIGENASWNENDGTGYNSNLPPTGGVPSYFYQYAPCCSELPNSDFAAVDGAYGGTTDDIFRVYACKWGINEDYVRAQAWIESGWHQDCAAAHGGSGCNEGGDENNPAGCTTGLPNTSISPNGQFCGMEGFGGLASPNQYDSWSIVQNKVYYQWMTWPMMEESTPFGVDYRYAEMRGCVNGDQYSYFNSQSSSSGTDYQNAVNAAKTDPSGISKVAGWTNLQYLAYGCIQTHYTGNWFSGNADSYLNDFLGALNSAPWPGHNQ